jgi:dTDP-L-rhamnose 4-epimerase
VKKILITGGAGFIGSSLSLDLISRGHVITVLDNLSPQIHGQDPLKESPLYNTIKDKVKFIHGSVTSREDWVKAIKDQDIIVHFAAETGTGQSMYQIEKYTEVNIAGTAIMLDLLTNTKHTVSKVIVASSRAIYGEGKYESREKGIVYPVQRSDDDMKKGDFEVKYPGCSALQLLPTDEESKIHPTSVYGITKQVQEQMVLTVCRALGIKAIAFRYQNVYGPGQSLSNPYTGILSIFSTQIRNGNTINIFEDGKESRDFVFISDVVAATVLGIEDETIFSDVFNVGAGTATSVIEIANVLLEKYNRKVPVEITGNYRVGDIRHNFADISKIKEKLGFTPKVMIEEGISKFAEWVSAQDVREDKYELSIAEMRERGLYK